MMVTRPIYLRSLGIILIYFFPGLLFCQITFEKTYGGIQNEIGYSVDQTTDGGYIVCGYTSSFGAGATDVYLIKTDSLGDTLWTKTYGDTDSDYGMSVEQTTDGGYIIVGHTGSFSPTYEVYLVKTDSFGDTIWTSVYGDSAYEYAEEVHETIDNGYIVVGRTSSTPTGHFGVYLIKTDSSGDSLWTKTFTLGNSDVSGYSIQQLADSGYIIASCSNTGGYLIRTDYLGDTIWTKTYPQCGFFSIKKTNDGCFVILGCTGEIIDRDFYLVKIDSIGDTLWTKIYGGNNNDFGRSVVQTEDDGFVLVGETWSYGSGMSDIYLMKTDSLGDSIWSRTFGGIGREVGYEVQQTPDSGYIISGLTGSFGAGAYDAYLLKTNNQGNIRVAEEIESNLPHNEPVKASPNPFSDVTNFTYSTRDDDILFCRIYDINGRLVKSGRKLTKWSCQNSVVNSAKSGIYFLVLKTKKTTETIKLILIR